MRIAREIREMLESMGVIQHGLLDPEYDTQRIDERIAAKLESVREAIQFVFDDRGEWAGTMLTNAADKALREILTMLSEEEPCIPDQSQKTA